MLGFQGSTSNSAATVKFTVNCKVVSKAVWDAVYQERPHIGAKPKANLGAGTFEWWYGIGQLMPGGSDKWWTIDETTDLVPLAAGVVQALEAYALPAMRAEILRS